MSGDIRADTLIVIRKGEIKPGATEFGSITLVVPNGRKMAERVAAAGYPPAHIVDGTNFVTCKRNASTGKSSRLMPRRDNYGTILRIFKSRRISGIGFLRSQIEPLC